MSLFQQKTKPPPPAAPTPARPAPRPEPAASEPRRIDTTHIASGSKVIGEISGAAELVIDGQVQGQINLDSRVVVGQEGRVEGEIQAQAVEVAGKVQGNVQGHDRVEVMTSGRLEGDVVSPRVVIAEGAFFKGNVDMTAEKTKPQKADKKAAAGHKDSPAGAKPAAARDKGGSNND